MTRRALAPLLAPLLLIASACSVHALLNDIDKESAKSVDIACDCTNVFPDRDACEAMFESFFVSVDRDCLEDALNTDKEASKATLECSLDATKAYNDCLEDKLDCNDGSSASACIPDYSECPQLPDAVQTAVSACGK